MSLPVVPILTIFSMTSCYTVRSPDNVTYVPLSLFFPFPFPSLLFHHFPTGVDPVCILGVQNLLLRSKFKFQRLSSKTARYSWAPTQIIAGAPVGPLWIDVPAVPSNLLSLLYSTLFFPLVVLFHIFSPDSSAAFSPSFPLGICSDVN